MVEELLHLVFVQAPEIMPATDVPIHQIAK
jgi:hypothetical protein